MLTTIPFSGFYDSLHSCALQTELDQCFSDSATGCEVNMPLAERAYNTMNWRGVHTEYAKEYAEAFAHAFSIPLEFESLSSPREYNFVTDRIFCTIEYADLCRIVAAFDLKEFAAHVREKFTSRDGFTSYYSPNLADWGKVESWDHNQCGTALEFYANQQAGGEFDVWDESGIMENARCNGVLESIFSSNCGENFYRLSRIHAYLDARAERAAA